LAQSVEFRSGSGKVRGFGTGLLLTIVTFGIYYYFWYFKLNDELMRVGESYSDRELAGSKPINSLMAVLFGGIIIVPPFLSVYGFCNRIQRAESLAGVSSAEQINPMLCFLLYFPLGILVIPAFFHYAMVTKHQNRVVLAAAEPDRALA
jgi:hypothetical protein